ncbi:sporulation protein YpjB [Shouchella shacheensis]|uniref:sporulation protein YpjB n=1 Tax=Shouchella shacheensis TaxID=1649580 RepID=UPI00073FB24D|nr:sporulation protein YpjB [Shouchella shacheensis]
MRFFKVLLASIALIVLPFSVMAANDDKKESWAELNHIADQVLQLTKQEKYEEAKKLMGLFSETFLDGEVENKEWTMSSLRTLTVSFEKAEGALTAVETSAQERLQAVTSFRLTVDALSGEHHPLWLHSQKTIMSALEATRDAANAGENENFTRQFNEFLSHYSVIRPALTISLESEVIQRLDSYNAYLTNQSSNLEEAGKHVEMMQEEYEKLFQQIEEDSADPSLLWVMLTIGGAVVTSLSYVGYRKYKAEKEKVKAKE